MDGSQIDFVNWAPNEPSRSDTYRKVKIPWTKKVDLWYLSFALSYSMYCKSKLKNICLKQGVEPGLKIDRHLDTDEFIALTSTNPAWAINEVCVLQN